MFDEALLGRAHRAWQVDATRRDCDTCDSPVAAKHCLFALCRLHDVSLSLCSDCDRTRAVRTYYAPLVLFLAAQDY